MDLRKKVGLTQQQLAGVIDVRVSTVSDWERGRSVPHIKPSQTKKLCEVLGCSLDELVELFEGA